MSYFVKKYKIQNRSTIKGIFIYTVPTRKSTQSLNCRFNCAKTLLDKHLQEPVELVNTLKRVL